jgi:hypothetical protein
MDKHGHIIYIHRHSGVEYANPHASHVLTDIYPLWIGFPSLTLSKKIKWKTEKRKPIEIINKRRGGLISMRCGNCNQLQTYNCRGADTCPFITQIPSFCLVALAFKGPQAELVVANSLPKISWLPPSH